MLPKGDGCFSVTREELLVAMRAGAVLWTSSYGPSLHDASGSELHPRRDTVRRLISDGVIVESSVANQVQRSCGMRTYSIPAPSPSPRSER